MSVTEELASLFTIFHDGCIENYKKEGVKLILIISCKYLAELIDPEFEYFYLELTEITLIELETFKNIPNSEKTPIILTEPTEIFREEIDIYRAAINNGNIEVNCWQVNEGLNYIANCLRLNCKTYTICDHNTNVIDLELLENLSAKYWSRF
ncbi:hypothetical protein R1T16_11330 [Flavobacterium sp. DG1-102-2]|uniref:hypothetical protein n=1 Tax=Flavobacterium sp. DG1-102-2 TaxID=3081663 RepID=UPI0029499872|nr:hypothetical protein [Flavobacterium sp. DG1-102-2]MDV6169021.1 hypothetical protein [Flavobacterium sp. DG1-102-2]